MDSSFYRVLPETFLSEMSPSPCLMYVVPELTVPKTKPTFRKTFRYHLETFKNEFSLIYWFRLTFEKKTLIN